MRAVPIGNSAPNGERNLLLLERSNFTTVGSTEEAPSIEIDRAADELH